MNVFELIPLIVTAVGVLSFSIIFTILYKGYANSAVAEFDSGQYDVELIYETILSNIKNSKRYRRVFRRIKQILLWLLIALLVPFLLLVTYSKVVNGVPMINGYGVIAVASGSMSQKNEANPYLANIDNQFNTYDVIVLEKIDSASELQLHDVIAYVNDDGANVIHRIVGFQQTASGVKYITRGDSNNADDIYKPSVDDVLGKYVGTRVPYLGAFFMFLQSYAGIVTLAAVIYCLIMIESISQKIYSAREERLLFLQDSIDFESDTVQDEQIDSVFTETVYFKDYVYVFDKNGLVSKTKREGQDEAQGINFVPEDAEEASGGDSNGD